MTGRILAGVDVGGTKIAVRLVDERLALVGRHRVEHGMADGIDAADLVTTAIDGALAAAGRSRTELEAIGIGVPGRVDPRSGTVTLAVNLDWQDVPVGPQVAARFGVPVAVENDVRAAAAALRAGGHADGVEDLAYIGIGTGISAGVVLGGRLHRGARGLAGEIGHVVLEPDGPPCACGLLGCLEALASGRGIAAIAEAELAGGAGGRLAARRPVTAADVYDAAAHGDPLATRVADRAARHLARAVHELVMAYDLRRVYLGGGVTAAGPAFEAPLARELDAIRAASPLAREAMPPDLVRVLPHEADPAGWGAVVLAARAAGRPDDPLPEPAPSGAGSASGEVPKR